VLEPDNRQGLLAPLIAAICAVFGGVMLAVFVMVSFGGQRRTAKSPPDQIRRAKPDVVREIPPEREAKLTSVSC
jgi:hypothetical protein